MLLSLALGTAANAQNITVNANSVSFEMVPVEGGTFFMGAQGTSPSQPNYYPDPNEDESPVHQVTLSSYYIGQTEVTQELWEAVTGTNPSYFAGGTHPVEQVSWNDCQDFISALNELSGLSFRLPTEVEWEFAARGGNQSEGYIYSGSNDANDVAWYFSVSDWLTHETATKLPNELGLYDMSGNVWEWCNDWYGAYETDPQTNPQGPDADSAKVARGGSWMDEVFLCRVTPRAAYRPQDKALFLGLRLAMDNTTSSSEEKSGNGKVQVYPTPANEKVQFSQEVESVAVYDVKGQLVGELQHVSEISTTALADGLYLLRIKTTGNGYQTQKMVVRH